jgi:hypothetical protein
MLPKLPRKRKKIFVQEVSALDYKIYRVVLKVDNCKKFSVPKRTANGNIITKYY